MRTTLLLAAAYAASGLITTTTAAEPTLAEIIEAVRENELLYERIDFTYRCKFETFNRHLLPPNDARSKSVHGEEARLRIVYQPPYYLRQEDARQWYGGDDRLEFPFYAAFDGDQTRLLQDRIGNISKGFARYGLYVTPHNLFVHFWAPIPLSLYLGGSEAIAQSEWKVGFASSVTSHYKGVEEWRGLRCHRVYLHHYFPGQGDCGSTELWLAEERNFIPARLVDYSFWLSRTEPAGAGEVTEWREIEPGIWFPWRSTVHAYHVGQLRPPGKDNRQSRRDITFESVQLRPEHALSFFRLEFPPGTHVYELEEGEIQRSYMAGSPADPKTREQIRASRWHRWWVVLGVIACVLAVIVVVRYRRRRRIVGPSTASSEQTSSSNPLPKKGRTDD